MSLPIPYIIRSGEYGTEAGLIARFFPVPPPGLSRFLTGLCKSNNFLIQTNFGHFLHVKTCKNQYYFPDISRELLTSVVSFLSL